MKLSVSVYAGPAGQSDSLVESLSKLDVDYLHVDCRNAADVFTDLQRWQNLTTIPFDVHLISPDPEPLIELARPCRIGRMCLQLEELATVPDSFWKGSYEKGLCITTTTPPSALLPYAAQLDYLMLMTTTPGQSGGVFPLEAFRILHELKRMFPGKPIVVDGGITESTACVLRILGVETAVSGSSILKHSSPEMGLYQFHRPLNSNQTDQILIRDFMWIPEALPVIAQMNMDFYDVLEHIDRSGMGFVLVTDATGIFKGVITNADVRKALLKFRTSDTRPVAADMLNAHPYTITAHQSLRDLIHLVNQLRSIVLFLPVTDAAGKLCGAVLLHQLTRL